MRRGACKGRGVRGQGSDSDARNHLLKHALMLLAILLLAASVAAAGTPQPPEDLVFFARRGVIEVVTVGGDPVKTLPGWGQLLSLFASGPGRVTALQGDGKLTELDRSGKSVWTFDLAKAPALAKVRLAGAEAVEGGRLLVWGTLTKKDPVRLVHVVAEIDREGKAGRYLELPEEIRNIHPAGPDRLVGVLSGAVVEVGWDGKRFPALALPARYIPIDAHKTERGTYLVVSNTTSLDRPAGEKAGNFSRLAEFSPDGKELWQAVCHGCPHAMQVLPDGHILTEGG